MLITVDITVGRAKVAEAGALEYFVKQASVRGVRVWAIAGDARAVLPAERAGYAERARAYAA